MFGFFEKKKVKEEEELEYTSPESLHVEEFVPSISKPEFIHEYDPEKKNIIVMDDQKGMVNIFIGELLSIKEYDVDKLFNILPIHGVYSAFKVERYIEANPDIKFDLAFLDMTLGGILKGVEYDGIDVAIMLKNQNSKCEVLFLTGHIMNERVSIIFDYMQKFRDYFKEEISSTTNVMVGDSQISIMDHIIPKSENRSLLTKIALDKYYEKSNDSLNA
jgi:hypothetical protein